MSVVKDGTAVLVGAAYGVFVYPTQLARAAVDRVIGALPSGWTARYEGIDYNLFNRRVTLTNVSLATPILLLRTSASRLPLRRARGLRINR